MAYDITLLSYALAVTMDLKYEVPLKVIYRIVEAMDKNGVKNLKCDEISSMIKLMGRFLKNKMASAKDDDDFILSDDQLMQDKRSKILYLLKSLNCDVSKDDLNKVLSGKLKIEDIASRETQMAWGVFFDRNGEKFVPNQDGIDLLLLTMRYYTLQEMYETKRISQIELKDSFYAEQSQNTISDNYKIEVVPPSSKQIVETIQDIERKIKMLRRYIAHMQGYDRDLDRDGVLGIDWETGYVYDFDDIEIADGYFDIKEKEIEIDHK